MKTGIKRKSNGLTLSNVIFQSQQKMLIGVDNADLHYSKADVNGRPGSPIARLGPLGWTCIGPTGRQLGKRSHLIMHSFLTRDAHIEKANVGCCDVNNTLRKFWEIETHGTETKRAEDNQRKEERAGKSQVIVNTQRKSLFISCPMERR